MRSSLDRDALAAYTGRQLAHFFPDDAPQVPDWSLLVGKALKRVEACFRNIRQRYYGDEDGEALFNHLNTDQYAAYLYLLSSTVFRETGAAALPAKLYGLNKALHGLDVFYEVELPEVFAFVHPVGTVVGRATYGNFFCIYQNCTVGGDLEGNHPTLGEGVVMFGGSRVIGSASIGANCLVSAGSVVMAENIPDNSAVFGISPHLVRKPTPRNVKTDMFGV
ncbi:Serine O-acetyltransferase [Rhodospirillaceae bacterium LM-1]|nr:Serine O-acetyltransferase [Rhodospirillaceae bacterium LM-1]